MADAADCGACMLVLADTVASKSLSKTKTHPDKTGRIEP